MWTNNKDRWIMNEAILGIYILTQVYRQYQLMTNSTYLSIVVWMCRHCSGYCSFLFWDIWGMTHGWYSKQLRICAVVPERIVHIVLHQMQYYIPQSYTTHAIIWIGGLPGWHLSFTFTHKKKKKDRRRRHVWIIRQV